MKIINCILIILYSSLLGFVWVLAWFRAIKDECLILLSLVYIRDFKVVFWNLDFRLVDWMHIVLENFVPELKIWLTTLQYSIVVIFNFCLRDLNVWIFQKILKFYMPFIFWRFEFFVTLDFIKISFTLLSLNSWAFRFLVSFFYLNFLLRNFDM